MQHAERGAAAGRGYRLRPFKTLRGLFSAAMVSLLILGGILGSLLFFTVWESRLEEQLQIVNWGLAREIAADLEPILSNQAGLDIVKLYDTAERYKRINQLISIYLLNGNGKVIVDFSGDAVNYEVPLHTVKAFFEDEARVRLPHRGPDPAKAGARAPFVAAPVNVGTDPGIVYVLLNNHSMRAFTRLFFRDASFRILIAGLSLSVVTVGALAYLVSWVVTSRFNVVSAALQRYSSGDLSARVEIAGDDELGRVAAAINSMAESIQRNLNELINKDALRRELILNVWHDLRSPITSLRAHIELLELNEQAPESEKRSSYYHIAFKNIDQLSQLLTELHELARLETKDYVPSFERCDLYTLSSELIAGFSLRPEAAGRTIHLDAAPGLPAAICDPAMITRVLVNLLENSFRYTPAGGSVTIALQQQAASIKVEVRDTGIGIPREALPHLFERWYQVNPGTGRPVGSSGLGLAIVRKIVEAHDSRIVVESKEGEGAVFSFTLERADEQEHAKSLL